MLKFKNFNMEKTIKIRERENLSSKKNLILLAVCIFSMLVIFFFMIYFSFNKISGKAVIEVSDSGNGIDYNEKDVSDNNEAENQAIQTPVSLESCSDSDKGLNYNEKGSVKYCDFNGNCINKADNCESGKLNEYYCENKKIAVERFYNCKYGCFNEACRITPVESSASGGSSGGSSSGESSSAEPLTQAINYETYSLGDLIVSEVELADNDKIKFNIIKNSSSTGYTITLSEHSLTSGKINIENPLQTISFSVGEEKYIDLDSDGSNEILLKLKSVSVATDKAMFLLTRA